MLELRILEAALPATSEGELCPPVSWIVRDGLDLGLPVAEGEDRGDAFVGLWMGFFGFAPLRDEGEGGLRFPDGGVADDGPATAVADVRAALREAVPGVLVEGFSVVAARLSGLEEGDGDKVDASILPPLSAPCCLSFPL